MAETNEPNDSKPKKKLSSLSENNNPPNDITEENHDPNKLSEEIEGQGYTPITGNPVNEKDYSQPYEKNNEDIAEPTFQQPTFEEVNAEAQGNSTTKVNATANPQLEQATSQEKTQGAEILADAILDGYEKLHELAGWYVSVDEEALLEKSLDDKIDLAMEIPADEEGGTVTLKEFVSNFNDQSKQALTLDPSFKEKVREPMIRVFIKRGWGLSDEQYLGYMFGRDIVEKTTIMVGLKRSMNRTMTMLEKSYAKLKQVKTNIDNVPDDNQGVYEGNRTNNNNANPNQEEVHYTTVVEPEETQHKSESNLKETVIVQPDNFSEE